MMMRKFIPFFSLELCLLICHVVISFLDKEAVPHKGAAERTDVKARASLCSANNATPSIVP